MARRNDIPTVDFTAPESETEAATPEAEVPTPAAKVVDPDRGNIGTVVVEDDDDSDWVSARTRNNDNPVFAAVRDAELGKPRSIRVERDDKKIERVKRMLRSAGTAVGVGVSIESGHRDIDGEPGVVKVRFKTKPRAYRTTTEATQTPPAE